MHTTAHIMCAIVNRETGALITGNQISPDESRIDFNLEQFDREKISDYTKAANDVVARGLEVKSYFMNREEALRMPGLVKLANALPPSVDVLQDRADRRRRHPGRRRRPRREHQGDRRDSGEQGREQGQEQPKAVLLAEVDTSS